MRIKLTQDYLEPTGIKVMKRPGQPAVVFEKGTVIDMSEASGRKYIEEQRGVEVDDDVAAE